jgi:hypothetical protein
MRTRLVLALVLALAMTVGVVSGLLRPAMAAEGDISVGGVWVSKITHDAAGYSASQRAVEVNKRITEVLSSANLRRTGATVSVRPNGGSAMILVNDQLVMTVTPEDAAGTGVSTVELARQWAQRLAQGLSKAIPDPNVHTF